MTVSPLGDSAVVVTVGESLESGTGARVRALAAALANQTLPGVTDIVPAYATVAVFFDAGDLEPVEKRCERVRAACVALEAAVAEAPEPRRIEIPVCYGGEFGPDLESVARHAGIGRDEVIALHRGAVYQVQAIGFAPGFPYLSGLPERLATPRRATPRALVPAGSVGIGGGQTGIYPLATPGGWNLIGRTPLTLFDAGRDEPAWLRAGDHVTFRAIDAEEFGRLLSGTRSGSAGNSDETSTPLHRIEVQRAGMFTTVQDLGRVGRRAEGVPLSGAADPFALRVANLLVGNVEGAPALEITRVGPELTFSHDALVAVCGAEFEGLPAWRPFAVAGGATLRFGAARRGCRGYLAIAGGIALEPVLGSCSTYTKAALGGWDGRALRDGDELPVNPVVRRTADRWTIDPRVLPRYSDTPVVRVLRGAQADEFSPGWAGREFVVSTQSDRMGVRLEGEPLVRNRMRELLSAPVAPGTVQVPPDGQPIVLLADAQTIGGYPQLAHVISTDLPVVAQLRPGDRLRFAEVTAEEAFASRLAVARAVALLRQGVAEKLA